MVRGVRDDHRIRPGPGRYSHAVEGLRAIRGSFGSEAGEIQRGITAGANSSLLFPGVARNTTRHRNASLFAPSRLGTALFCRSPFGGALLFHQVISPPA